MAKEMETLKKLVPAETYLIRQNSRSTFKELMKLTLADLCLKKVLRIEEHEEESHPNDPPRTIRMVSTGERFMGYKPRAHEFVFLSPFHQDTEIEVPFKDLIKLAFQKARSRKHYVFELVFDNAEVKQYFKQGFWTRLLGSTVLSDRGLTRKEEIDQVLQQLEAELPELMKTDMKRAKEILTAIGGNVLLLTTLDFELLKKIDEELAKGMETSHGDEGWIWLDAMLWFGDDGEFDSAFDSADNSAGWSGCGGDSGCSGCSGCGGCGGCGS